MGLQKTIYIKDERVWSQAVKLAAGMGISMSELIQSALQVKVRELSGELPCGCVGVCEGEHFTYKPENAVLYDGTPGSGSATMHGSKKGGNR